MSFNVDLFGNRVVDERKKASPRASGARGCDACPLGDAYNVRKVKGLVRIKRRRAMLWAQNPGKQENARGLELVGPAGELLWTAARSVGLSRDDFDIQNVVRCLTLTDVGTLRPPTKEELYCCSTYNERALEKNAGSAQVHLILGKMAGVQLLGRAYKKDRPIFWHAPWNAYVVLAEHPSYLLRLGGAKKAGWKYHHFRDMLAATRSILDNPGRAGYVLNRKRYFLVDDAPSFEKLRRIVTREARAGRRIAVDIEDAPTSDGKKELLLCGLSWGHMKGKGRAAVYSGGAASILFSHPDKTPSVVLRKRFRVWLRAFLEDEAILKVFQHGSYDVPELERYFDCRVRGYDFDSQYAAYFRFPHLRSYSLENLVINFFPEFADYKTLPKEYFRDDVWDMSRVPLDILWRYNCADADVTKRVEVKVGEQISLPLLRAYVDAAFTLDGMETRGPWLDKQNIARIKEQVPRECANVLQQLRQVAGDPDFNPGSPKQVAALLYDKLGLPPHEEYNLKLGRMLPVRSTAKSSLQKFVQTGKSPVPSKILRYRALSKIDSTYLNGWQRSADMHGGQIRTRWHLTGAATSRLRSGGAVEDGRVNFQNFHGNYLLLDLLVSDKRWRRALEGDDVDDLWVFLGADYSQVEIRMLAQLAQDKLLISQLNKREDIHCQVGAALTGWKVSRIKEHKQTRRLIKGLHFGIIFGIGRGRSLLNYLIARGVKTTEQQSNKYYDLYFKRYAGVAAFIDKMRKCAEDTGYVETLFGFRRELGVWDDKRGTYWANQAVNTPVQGTAHQLLLMALALLRTKPRKYALLQKPVMEIHDALYFFVRLRDLFAAREQLLYLMQDAVPEYVLQHFGIRLDVPLLAESEAGFTLGSMTALDELVQAREFLPAWRKTRLEHLKEGWEDLDMDE